MSTAVQLSLDEGLAKRDFNLELLRRKYPRLVDRLRAVAVAICRIRETTHGGGWVTADDVRAIVPLGDAHPSVMGAVFRPPLFRFVDWQQSSQPRRHRNRVGVWTLNEDGASG